MIKIREGVTIYVYGNPVDMRKAVNGLSIIVTEELVKPLTSGDIYLFYNKRGDLVKALYWDKNGFALHQKRLEKGRYKCGKGTSAMVEKISELQLAGLLVGLDYELMTVFSDMNYDEIF